MQSGWKYAAVMALLFVFGVAYNWLIEQLENRGHDRGYTSLLVVGGVLVTIVATVPLIGVKAVVVLALAFAASGTPMIVGSILRYVRERARMEELSRQRVLEELEDGDTP